jgi:hypothetical protein
MQYIYIIFTLVLLYIIYRYNTYQKYLVIKSNYEFNTNIENKKTAVVFVLNDSAGFFSQFFFLCHSYIFAQKNNYTFFVDSKNWTYTYSKGWNDYFDSLTEISDNIKNDYNLLYYSHLNINQSPENNYTINDYINCIKKIYILNNSILTKANNYINNTIKSPYISIYIRRGDKLVSEAPFIDIKDITKSININNSTNLFVQTDDYNVIKELKLLYPSNKIHYTVPETSSGTYQNQYNNNNPNNIIISNMNKLDIKNHTEELLVGTYICSKSYESWCDVTSNVSRFIILNNITSAHTYPTNINFDYNKQIEPWYGI